MFPVFNGIEVDVISIGDADCIVVTQWTNSVAHRILIDGGCAGDVEVVTDFLLSRGYTKFWFALCTHLHNDHANGLIKIVQDRRFEFTYGNMHDLHKHVSADVLRRASAANDGVKEVAEKTKELAAAFASRNMTLLEPFAGMKLATWPDVIVLGPSVEYYNKVMAEFTNVKAAMSIPIALPSLENIAARRALYGLSGLGGLTPPFTNPPSLSSLIPPPTPKNRFASLLPLPPLTGALGGSSLLKKPTTQPFNNTSVILGMRFGEIKLLLPGDAGSEALSFVGSEWNHLTYFGVPHHGSDGNVSQGDIERFCPEFAVISAKGDSSHPSRAVVSGLVKVGAKVASTHEHGNLWFWSGTVPARTDYGPCEFLKGTGTPEPLIKRLGAL
jgi:beta-lactamase superfamily II metal-dependent hydrolase